MIKISTSTNIYQILKAIDLSYENDNFNLDKTLSIDKLKISFQRLILLINNLEKDGYIEGLSIQAIANDQPCISINKPRLTTKGLLFLEENSVMKKAYNTLKELREWIPG